ncbi:MAG: DUF2333 family protein [Candidatus Adiutrix sp.]|jgi:hypothetical protein|nr:DUF2333 family protein [Candidatus Adiutrix sp.]
MFLAKFGLFKKKAVQIPLAILLVLILFSVFITIINYRFPAFFTLAYPDDGVSSPAIEAGLAPSAVNDIKKGLMTADTLIVIGDELFSNWLPNDKVWPTVFLDNPQNFQLGQLEMMRYTARVMRDKLTRLRTTDKIDPDCDEAFTFLSNDPLKWWMPTAESRFNGAVDKLKSYRSRLAAGQAEFYPRADNLYELLDQYVSLLGGVNTRLANAPHRQRYKISEESAGEVDASREEHLVDTKVPWTAIDDNFYYAQGVAYVLRQSMAAIRHDFQEILEVKKATAQIDSIIEVLDQSQFEPWMVLNGDIGSVMANHSMELHSILENARQKIRNLNDMIKQ